MRSLTEKTLREIEEEILKVSNSLGFSSNDFRQSDQGKKLEKDLKTLDKKKKLLEETLKTN